MAVRLIRPVSLLAAILGFVAPGGGAAIGVSAPNTKVPSLRPRASNHLSSSAPTTGATCAKGLRTVHLPLSTVRGPKGSTGATCPQGATGATGPQGVAVARVSPAVRGHGGPRGCGRSWIRMAP